MFFTTILMMFMLIGSILCIFDIAVPGLLVPVVAMGFRYTGLILMWTGSLLYVARSYQTGGNYFTELPNPGSTILINMGSSCARIIRAKKDVLNTLLHKNTKKRFKDMGEAIRVAGHDVQISNETQYPTYPLWLIDLIDKYKNRYGVKTHDELMSLFEKIKTTVRCHDDLWNIPELNPVLSDDKKLESLMSMSMDDIHNLSEQIFDGRTINVEAYLEWFENSTAYETESLINKTVDHRIGQDASYRFAGGVDWGKIAIPLFIIILALGIFYQFLTTGG